MEQTQHLILMTVITPEEILVGLLCCLLSLVTFIAVSDTNYKFRKSMCRKQRNEIQSSVPGIGKRFNLFVSLTVRDIIGFLGL